MNPNIPVSLTLESHLLSELSMLFILSCGFPISVQEMDEFLLCL